MQLRESMTVAVDALRSNMRQRGGTGRVRPSGARPVRPARTAIPRGPAWTTTRPDPRKTSVSSQYTSPSCFQVPCVVCVSTESPNRWRSSTSDSSIISAGIGSPSLNRKGRRIS